MRGLFFFSFNLTLQQNVDYNPCKLSSLWFLSWFNLLLSNPSDVSGTSQCESTVRPRTVKFSRSCPQICCEVVTQKKGKKKKKSGMY